jgi:hypothetical protein
MKFYNWTLFRFQLQYLSGGFMGEDIHTPAYPAPWELSGTGYILLYRFTGEFCRTEGFIPDSLQGSFRGGLGTVMYVDYRSSNAGPYQELLFIPGRFEFSGKKYYSITRIYVSTRESVDWGRANWGIPKGLASFEKTAEGKGVERITVQADGVPVAQLLFRRQRMCLPVTTAFVPKGLRTLAHAREGITLLTTPESKGALAPARLLECRINRELFPGIDDVRPLCTVHVQRFSMVFPRARTL